MLTTAQRTKNLRLIAAGAVAAEKDQGVPAELITAQAILESGWLEFAPGNNPFGIKEYAGAPKRQMLDTSEWFTPRELAQFLARGDGRTAVIALKNGAPQKIGQRQKYWVRDWFAAYDSLAQAFSRHSSLLLTKAVYADATRKFQQDHNLDAYIDAIARYYATSPDYATQIKTLIGQKNVKTALADARAAA